MDLNHILFILNGEIYHFFGKKPLLSIIPVKNAVLFPSFMCSFVTFALAVALCFQNIHLWQRLTALPTVGKLNIHLRQRLAVLPTVGKLNIHLRQRLIALPIVRKLNIHLRQRLTALPIVRKLNIHLRQRLIALPIVRKICWQSFQLLPKMHSEELFYTSTQINMNNIKNFIFIFIFSMMLLACERSAEKGNLPTAKGSGGEIIIFMDSVKWRGEVGKAVREVFHAPLTGTLRDERIFTLRYIEPSAFNNFIKSHKNIVMITSFESNSLATKRLKGFYDDESLKKIAQSKNDSLFMILNRDQYAKDQLLLFLFAKTDKALIEKLKENKAKLQEMFESAELRRLTPKVYASQEQNNINKLIKTKHDFTIRVPFGYEEVVNEISKDKKEGFIWERILDQEVDKSIFVAYKPYLSQSQFERDSIIAWRNQLCGQHIFGDPAEKDSTFVITETLEPAVTKPVMVKGRYTVETRGLWRTFNISMGGSFVSYVFADSKKGRIYYAEGFLYAPSKMTKREYLRELQVIITTVE
jgi:hypothetical protein